MERFKWFDLNPESYAEFIEENDRGDEMKSRNDPVIIMKDKKAEKAEFNTNNNPDSITQLNPSIVNNDNKSEIEAKKK